MTRYIQVFQSPELRQEGFRVSENILLLLAKKTMQGRKAMGCSGLEIDCWIYVLPTELHLLLTELLEKLLDPHQ